MWDDTSDRTEVPSRRRREEARHQGRVARSTNLTAALMLGGAAGMLGVTGPTLLNACAQLLSASLRQHPITHVDGLIANGPAMNAVLSVALTGLTIVGSLWLLACGANLLQTGPLLTLDTLQPRTSRMSPLAGIARLLSMDTLVRGALLVAQVIGVALLVGRSLRTGGVMLAELPALSVVRGASAVGGWLTACGGKLAAWLLVLSIIDYAWQHWRLERCLRMTRQEIRDEQRQSEGPKPSRHGRQSSAHGRANTSLTHVIDVERA